MVSQFVFHIDIFEVKLVPVLCINAFAPFHVPFRGLKGLWFA